VVARAMSAWYVDAAATALPAHHPPRVSSAAAERRSRAPSALRALWRATWSPQRELCLGLQARPTGRRSVNCEQGAAGTVENEMRERRQLGQSLHMLQARQPVVGKVQEHQLLQAPEVGGGDAVLGCMQLEKVLAHRRHVAKHRDLVACVWYAGPAHPARLSARSCARACACQWACTGERACMHMCGRGRGRVRARAGAAAAAFVPVCPCQHPGGVSAAARARRASSACCAEQAARQPQATVA